MLSQLIAFLRESRSSLSRKQRINVVRERAGYSDITWWDTTVSFDEIEVFDFDALLEKIDEFSKTFDQTGKGSIIVSSPVIHTPQ